MFEMYSTLQKDPPFRATSKQMWRNPATNFQTHVEKGQAHDMFSRIFRIRIYEFFYQILCDICFDFLKWSKLRKKTWEIAVKKFVDSYSENSWKHVVNSITVKDIEAEEQKRKEVKENKVDPPTHRSNLSLLAHPDHPELVLFGGEFHNGNKTTMFNDLLIFNTKRYHSYIT